MIFDKLILKNIRGVKDCTLNFHKNINLILGKNETGKTLLLKLIADEINKQQYEDACSRIVNYNHVSLFPEYDSSGHPCMSPKEGIAGRCHHIEENIIGSNIIIAEHITSRIHWSYMNELVRHLNVRQCFLETHDAELIDRMNFESSSEIQNKIVICCQIVNRDNYPGVEFRNIDNVEAEDIFNSYKVGIQHLSEILKTHGIW